jgi:hypothetical protein
MGKLKDALLGLTVGSSYTDKINQRDRFFDAIIYLSRTEGYKIIFYPFKLDKEKNSYQIDTRYTGYIEEKKSLQLLRDQIRGSGLVVSADTGEKRIFLSTENFVFTMSHICSLSGITASKAELNKIFHKLDYYMDGGSSEFSSELDPFSIVEDIKEVAARLIKNQRR